MLHALFAQLATVLKIGVLSTTLIGTSLAWAISPSEFVRFDIADFSRDQSNISGIQVIAEDSHGFIWAGGENGLARFTGQRATLYRSTVGDSNSIAGNFVRDLLFENDHILWVATANGLSRFDIRSDQFTQFNRQNGFLPGNDVSSLERLNNQLIIGTTSGLAVLNLTTQERVSPPFIQNLDTHFHVESMAQQGANLWLGSTHGLAKINLQSHQVTIYHHDTEDPDNPEKLPYMDAFSLFPQHNTLWIGSMEGGLYQQNIETEQFSKLPGDIQQKIGLSVVAVSGNSTEDIWIATDFNGLWYLNSRTLETKHYPYDPAIEGSIHNNKPRATYTDKKGNFWVGTFSGILNFHYRGLERGQRLFKESALQAGLADNSILSILERENDIWVGTEGGLSQLSKSGKPLRNFTPANTPELTVTAALSLEEGQDNDIWVGTWAGGLLHYDIAQDHWESHNTNTADNPIHSDHIWALERDKKDNLWLGTHNNGVEKIHLPTGKVTHYPPAPFRSGGFPWEMVRDIETDASGNVWFATFKGLARYRESTDDFEVYTHKTDNENSLKGAQFLALLAHSNGELWVGSRSNGISIFNPISQQYRHIGLAQGLPAITVNTIIEDKDHNIWVATPNGIAVINAGTDTVERVFKKYDGLASNIYYRNSSAALSDGTLALGGKDGLALFNPQLLKIFRISQRPIITAISINFNKSQPHLRAYQNAKDQPLKLTFDQNTIGFDFALSNYYHPQLNQFSYRLVGFDDTWRPLENTHQAYFTNLPDGHYIFEVRAKSADSIWGQASSAVFFNISPPLTRSWWAYILYVIILYSIILAVKKYLAIVATSSVYRRLSIIDTLTELPNRLAINQTVEKWSDKQLAYSVLVIDLDFFKRVNDTYGHEAGDKILKDFSSIANTLLAKEGKLGRWGGEEFIVVLKGYSASNTQTLGEALCKATEATTFTFGEIVIPLTISIGGAVLEPDESFTKIFQRADEALYHAKHNGRNQVAMAATTTHLGARQ